MGRVKLDDVIGWESNNGRIFCDDCEKSGENLFPLTEADVEDEVVTCDECKMRIH